MRGRLVAGLAAGGILLLVGCTITIAGTPVQLAPGTKEEICIVPDPTVRAEFLTALTSSLQQKRFEVRLLDPTATPADCPLTATYLAKWSWDYTTYMATADITVFLDGAKVGSAIYRAPRGGWSMTFGIYKSTATKVGLMVDQLFPDRP